MKKDTYIRVRLSAQDKDLLRAAAEASQMTMSEYITFLIRRINLNYNVAVSDPLDDRLPPATDAF